MKKMKGVVAMESPVYPVCEDQRARLRHQSLLQDYEDLLEETNSLRMKLQAAKQKRLTLSAEVRFLRKRYKYLLKNPSPKPQPKKNNSHLSKLKIQPNLIPKSQKYNRKEFISHPPVVCPLNSNGRISDGAAEIITLHKKAHMFDLNQNARSLGRKEHSFLNSTLSLDLNHKDTSQSIKEPTKKSITPFFDLNQIAREEEELLVTEPVRIEEPMRITQRGASEDQHNDIKLSVCRNDGSGSSRTVKRKISWQDQVALKV